MSSTCCSTRTATWVARGPASSSLSTVAGRHRTRASRTSTRRRHALSARRCQGRRTRSAACTARTGRTPSRSSGHTCRRRIGCGRCAGGSPSGPGSGWWRGSSWRGRCGGDTSRHRPRRRLATRGTTRGRAAPRRPSRGSPTACASPLDRGTHRQHLVRRATAPLSTRELPVPSARCRDRGPSAMMLSAGVGT